MLTRALANEEAAYGTLIDERTTKEGDTASSDVGATHEGHYLDVVRIAVAGEASEEVKSSTEWIR